MKTIVVGVDLKDEGDKRKAMKCVTNVKGIDLVSIDMQKKQMTVMGDVDPVIVVDKLRKGGSKTELIMMGPNKEEKDKDKKKDEGKKVDERKKIPGQQMVDTVNAIKKIQDQQKFDIVNVNRYPNVQPYFVYSWEEDPNSCVVL